MCYIWIKFTNLINTVNFLAAVLFVFKFRRPKIEYIKIFRLQFRVCRNRIENFRLQFVYGRVIHRQNFCFRQKYLLPTRFSYDAIASRSRPNRLPEDSCPHYDDILEESRTFHGVYRVEIPFRLRFFEAQLVFVRAIE